MGQLHVKFPKLILYKLITWYTTGNTSISDYLFLSDAVMVTKKQLRFGLFDDFGKFEDFRGCCIMVTYQGASYVHISMEYAFCATYRVRSDIFLRFCLWQKLDQAMILSPIGIAPTWTAFD